MSAKTGSRGRPWVQLEPNRPPKVPDEYDYWSSPPPELSARCRYWLRQIAAGLIPNRRWWAECNQCRASLLGIYVWEQDHVIGPVLERVDEHGIPEAMSLDMLEAVGN